MKNVVCLMCAVCMSIFAVSCATTEVKEQPVVATSLGSDAIVKAQNEQLAKVSVEGFALGNADVPAQKWDSWAKVAAPVVKTIIDNLPKGYVFQVTGHADSTGSEDASAGFVGNKKLSEQRAYAVYSSLKKQGITSSRITYKGVGSSEPLSGVSGDGDAQRRVSFRVVASN